MQYFGEHLRAKRLEKGWTQDQLADKSGLSKGYISTLERNQPHTITGALPKPTPIKVEKLAKALDWDLNEARNAAGYIADSSTYEDAERVELEAMYSKRRNLTPTKKEAFKRILDMVDRELDRLYEESLIEEQGNKSQTNGA